MKLNYIHTMLVSLLSCSAAFATMNAKVDITKTYQTIEHFGAADAWSGNLIGQWADKERNKVADWLFSTENDSYGNPKGIGLSLWRVNLGGGSWEQGDDSGIKTIQKRAESFLTLDGKQYDWKKCAGQQWLMEAAKKRGCEKFLLFVNSPHVSMTISGKAWNSQKSAKGNLKPECYGAFADYLATIAKYFTKKGFEITYISPANEPQWMWDTGSQEGTPYYNSELARIVRELDKALEAHKLSDTKIIIAESERIANLYELEYARKPRVKAKHNVPDDEIVGNQIKVFFDKNSPHYVGDLKHVLKAINSHSYDSDKTVETLKEERAPLAAELEKYGIGFHASEFITIPHLRTDSDMGEKGNPSEMNEALHLARVIHTDLTFTPSVTWQNWKAIELYDQPGRALVHLYPKTGDVREIEKGGYAQTSKLLWGMGNFSRFIRPNYKRVSFGGFEDIANKTFGSAWLSPDGKRLVLVCENTKFEDEVLNLTLPAEFNDSKVVAYQTSERMDLAKIDVPAKKNLKLPQRSITTFVFEK